MILLLDCHTLCIFSSCREKKKISLNTSSHPTMQPTLPYHTTRSPFSYKIAATSFPLLPWLFRIRFFLSLSFHFFFFLCMSETRFISKVVNGFLQLCRHINFLLSLSSFFSCIKRSKKVSSLLLFLTSSYHFICIKNVQQECTLNKKWYK